MLLLDEIGAGVPNQVRILATDISQHALQTAAEGIYTAEKLDAVPPDVLRRIFCVAAANGKDRTRSGRNSGR